MARLIVEAVSGETKSSDVMMRLEVIVSVSRADTGESVTALDKSNFRICSSIGLAVDMEIVSCYERKWETADTALAGCYSLAIGRKNEGDSSLKNWSKGEFYVFGIQAIVPKGKGNATDLGQTIIRVESMGQ